MAPPLQERDMRLYATWDDLREAMPSDLPFGIREAILGNVVVGNFTDNFAVRLAQTIGKGLREGRQLELFNKD